MVKKNPKFKDVEVEKLINVLEQQSFSIEKNGYNKEEVDLLLSRIVGLLEEAKEIVSEQENRKNDSKK